MEGYWFTTREVLDQLPIMNYFTVDTEQGRYFIKFPESTKFVALEDRMIAILENKQPLTLIGTRIRFSQRRDMRMLPPKWQDYLGADFYKQEQIS